MRDPYEKFETATLQNGLTLYNLHWPDQTGARFEFLIHSGARHDPAGKEGAAHFMEHLVSANAMIPFDDLMRFFEHNSGYQPRLGTTHPNGTWYGFLSSTEPQLLKQSLTYFGHMLLQSTLEKDVEREREVIIGEFNRKYPMQVVYDMYCRKYRTLFPNTFLGRSPSGLGTKETIATLQQSDLQAFYDTHYTPANMSVIVIGELTITEAVAALENSPFGEEKPGTRSISPTIITDPPFPSETEYRFHEGEYFKGKSTASFGTSAQLPGTFSSTLISVVSKMLDRQLFKVVRMQNAWAYSVGCGIQSLGDFLEFQISCNALDSNAIDKISATVTRCIEDIRQQSNIFDEVKRSLVMSKKFSDTSGRSVRDNVRSDLLLGNRIVSLTEEIDEAEQIQMTDVLSVIDYLAPNRRWTVIGYP